MDDLKLYEGINNIDDDLIDEANVPARRPKYYTFALSAAAVLLVIGLSGIAFGGDGRYTPSRYMNTGSETTTSAAAESVTTAASTLCQSNETSYADTVTTRKVKETSKTTAVKKEAFVSDAETSVNPNTNVTAVQQTVKASEETAIAVKTAASVPIITETVTSAQEQSTQPVTADDIERSYDMKRVLSFLSAAVMLTPISAKTACAADAVYRDPAVKYGLGGERYIEESLEVSPAEQILFDRIDKGLIDIDIDRNGELDMRDAALLYTYEWLEYLKENPDDIDADDTFYRERFKSFDINTISDEARIFLETRDDIRDKELFSKSRYYTPWQVTHLDSDLIIRYHLTHTLTPDYFTGSYYSDVAGYNIAYNRFNSSVAFNRTQLLNRIREAFFTDLDYDLNGDGVFDLHDAQDYEEYQFGYKVYKEDYDKILSAESVDMSEYREYSDSADSISETVFKNCVKLEMLNDKYENTYSWDFQRQNGSSGIVKIGFQKMIELFFLRNDYKLVYSTPEYYTDDRPGCEGLPLYDRIDFYSFVEQYAGSHGYTTAKLSFNETDFNLFYEKWSADVKNGTASVPDINGSRAIDADDYSLLEQYEKELWQKTSAEDTELPENIRGYLDENFDLNGNGISGDLYDIMGATAFIRINYPECAVHSTEETTLKTASLQKGDVNCDGNVSVADAVAILQFIGNRDRYPLKEQGKKNADVNGDGAVTALDALEIQKMDADTSSANQTK